MSLFTLDAGRKTLYRTLVAGALIASFAAGAGANALWRSHPARLDLAVDHLNQINALLPAASDELPPDFSERGRREYDKNLDRATKAATTLMNAIVAMIQAADAG